MTDTPAPGPSSSPSAPPPAPAPAAPPASTSPAPSPAAAERPDYVPETHWDATVGKPKPEFGQHVKDLAAFKATEDSRRLTLPKTPDEYPFALPPGFKAPEGVDVTLNDKDPLVQLYRDFAHKSGLTTDQFSEGLGLLAAMRVSEHQAMKTAEAAQLQSLGANGSARVTAVHDWLTATLGVGAKTFTNFPLIASQVEGFEKIMQKFASQGGSGPNSGHRERPETNGKIPGYDTMTYAQKRDAQDRARAAQG